MSFYQNNDEREVRVGGIREPSIEASRAERWRKSRAQALELLHSSSHEDVCQGSAELARSDADAIGRILDALDRVRLRTPVSIYSGAHMSHTGIVQWTASVYLDPFGARPTDISVTFDPREMPRSFTEEYIRSNLEEALVRVVRDYLRDRLTMADD